MTSHVSVEFLNNLAQEPGARFLRRPGHRPEESARWYIRSPRGVEYRIPQPIAEIRERRFLAAQRKAEEKFAWEQMTWVEILQTYLRVFRLRVSEFVGRTLPRLKARMRRITGALTGLFLGLLVAVSCATLGEVTKEPVRPVLDRTESIELVLQNKSFRDEVVRVHYRRSGHLIERELVPSFTADTLTLPMRSPRGLRVQLQHFGGDSPWTLKGGALVRPGDVVFVTIRKRKVQSILNVRRVGQEYWMSRYDHPEGFFPSGLERINPPSRWLRWYRGAAECAGVESNPEDITWFVFNAALVPAPVGSIDGMYTFDEDHIYIRRYFARDTALIRHEALHRILKEQGFPNDRNAAHDTTLFAECAPNPTEGS